jgi:hypothetical protein
MFDLQVPASVDVTVFAGRRRPGLVLRLREHTGAAAVARVRPLDGPPLLCIADETTLAAAPRAADAWSTSSARRTGSSRSRCRPETLPWRAREGIRQPLTSPGAPRP